MNKKKVKSPEERSTIALKAVETRRKRNPKWGEKARTKKNVCWQDYEKLHEQLATYCGQNGLVINETYAKLVSVFLKNPKIIEEQA